MPFLLECNCYIYLSRGVTAFCCLGSKSTLLCLVCVFDVLPGERGIATRTWSGKYRSFLLQILVQHVQRHLSGTVAHAHGWYTLLLVRIQFGDIYNLPKRQIKVLTKFSRYTVYGQLLSQLKTYPILTGNRFVFNIHISFV